MLKGHIESNGDGKLYISKTALTLISLILLLLGSVIPIVWGYGRLGRDVENIGTTLDLYIPKQEKINDVYSKELGEQKVSIAVLQERLDSIDEGIEEIKMLVKRDR